MQWKGPFDILALLLHSCERERGDLLKKCIVRNVDNDEKTTVDDGTVSTASLAVAEVQSSGCNEFGCKVLLELGGLGSQKALDGLRLVDELTGCLRSSCVNWKSWQALSPPFCLDLSERKKSIKIDQSTIMSLLPMLLFFGVAMIGPVQGYVTYKGSDVTKGKKYYVSNQWESFNLAKMNERCKKDLGGYLLQLDRLGEQATVTHFIFYAGWGPFFTGITDEKSEGKYYHYNDNKPAKDLGWKLFQPDNWYNEDCVEIWQDGLNDRKCGDRGRYICEVHV
ncbi:hypothetical protein PoB_000551500 [Plakobranchus ocellatus]|uniref:C-type lectin domain-containing protein n=1 Tax=Plakobranchus ocellatus TaxID=259542 RepID=A0AAV3Y7A0_9GAST|nr:hypothetical protein PoB_000551500 [Plakobranchus ocellatus]